MLADRAAIALAVEESGGESSRLAPALKSAAAWVARLRSIGESALALAELIERVELSSDGIRLALKVPLLPLEAYGGPDHLSLNKIAPLQMKRRGVEMRLVLEGDSTPSRVNLPLLKAVARTRRWSQELISGRVQSVGELRSGKGSTADRFGDCCRLGSFHQGYSRRSWKAASRPTLR